MSKSEVAKWSDMAMYRAVPTASEDGAPVVPKVYLLSATPDPLGAIAAASLMYKGMPIRSLSEVADKDRMEFFGEMKKTRLNSPFEFVDLHFMIEGVTRAFTHQMVRQRTAVYVQESQRFAVKENGEHEVGMPPSLVGVEIPEWFDGTDFEYDRLTEDQKKLLAWQQAVTSISDAYMSLVNQGMPAEDARGLLPTNITTRIHYKTNLRALLEHSGNRLCTQAQFEWRIVWSGFLNAMRKYGAERNEAWQWDEISSLFAPICYQTGKCEFMANMDRHCDIRDRVQAYHANGVGSSEWADGRADLGIPAINPQEWLANPASARRKA